MSFFHPRVHQATPVHNPGFASLFRMLEDFDQYNTTSKSGSSRGSNSMPVFQPKFDILETDTTYELHGEFPGLNRDNLHIEFIDPQNIAIRGRVERSYQRNTKTTCSSDTSESSADASTHNNHQARVDDEELVDAADNGVVSIADEEDTATPAASVADCGAKTLAKNTSNKAKYWITERNIGDFNRTFNFPQRVEQDGVTANLKDGILTVVVPKAKKYEARRIEVA